MGRLRRGDLGPLIRHPPPGPASRRLARQLARYEAPGINTVGPDGTTLVWEEALGANVLDVDGNRFIDLTSGFGTAAVGHRHPAVVAAVREQAGRLVQGLADVHAHRLRSQLAQKLTRLAPVTDAQVFFAVSGSDAVEIALKTALLATGREGILAFNPAYHGLSLGALQASARVAFRQPFAAHFHGRDHRLPFGCPVEEVDALLRANPEIACLIVEPIVGREGVLVPPTGWLAGLRRVCRAYGALLIVDEIFTGFGRTGRTFALDFDGVEPDLLCCGKALGGGLPIGVAIGRRDLLSHWKPRAEALHTGTFVAHPLSCAAAMAVLRVLASERLVQRAGRLGQLIEGRIGDWPQLYPAVVAVRGRGLLWGIELETARLASRLTRDLMRQGVLALAGGPEGRVLQLVPPLVITEPQLFQALDILAAALARREAGGI